MSIIHDLIDEATSRLRGKPSGSVMQELAAAQNPAVATMATTPLRGMAASTLGLGAQGLGGALRDDLTQQLADRRKKTATAAEPGNLPMYASASADIFSGKGY